VAREVYGVDEAGVWNLFRKRCAVILAGGTKTFRDTDGLTKPVVLRKVDGKPSVVHFLDKTSSFFTIKPIVVVNRDNEQEIKTALDEAGYKGRVEYVVQEKPLGSGDALLSAEDHLRRIDHLDQIDIGLFHADVPGFDVENAKLAASVLQTRTSAACSMSVPTAIASRSKGAFERDALGEVRVYRRRAAPLTRVNEGEGGCFFFRASEALRILREIRDKEYDDASQTYQGEGGGILDVTRFIDALLATDRTVVALPIMERAEILDTETAKNARDIARYMERKQPTVAVAEAGADAELHGMRSEVVEREGDAVAILAADPIMRRLTGGRFKHGEVKELVYCFDYPFLQSARTPNERWNQLVDRARILGRAHRTVIYGVRNISDRAVRIRTEGGVAVIPPGATIDPGEMCTYKGSGVARTKLRQEIAHALGVTLDEETGAPVGDSAAARRFEVVFFDIAWFHEAIGHDEALRPAIAGFGPRCNPEVFASMVAKLFVMPSADLSAEEQTLCEEFKSLVAPNRTSRLTQRAPEEMVVFLRRLIDGKFRYDPDGSDDTSWIVNQALQSIGIDSGELRYAFMDLTFEGNLAMKAALLRAIDRGELIAMSSDKKRRRKTQAEMRAARFEENKNTVFLVPINPGVSDDYYTRVWKSRLEEECGYEVRYGEGYDVRGKHYEEYAAHVAENGCGAVVLEVRHEITLKAAEPLLQAAQENGIPVIAVTDDDPVLAREIRQSHPAITQIIVDSFQPTARLMNELGGTLHSSGIAHAETEATEIFIDAAAETSHRVVVALPDTPLDVARAIGEKIMQTLSLHVWVIVDRDLIRQRLNEESGHMELVVTNDETIAQQAQRQPIPVVPARSGLPVMQIDVSPDGRLSSVAPLPQKSALGRVTQAFMRTNHQKLTKLARADEAYDVATTPDNRARLRQIAEQSPQKNFAADLHSEAFRDARSARGERVSAEGFTQIEIMLTEGCFRNFAPTHAESLRTSITDSSDVSIQSPEAALTALRDNVAAGKTSVLLLPAGDQRRYSAAIELAQENRQLCKIFILKNYRNPLDLAAAVDASRCGALRDYEGMREFYFLLTHGRQPLTQEMIEAFIEQGSIAAVLHRINAERIDPEHVNEMMEQHIIFITNA
jgi:dTDP-glucose pyrophosphorylase/rRNA-processing protein FCF1